MGNYMTKLLVHNQEAHNGKRETEPWPLKSQEPIEGNLCTPINSQGKLFLDPRSATTGIHRTPIEVDSIPLQHNLRTTEFLREKKPYLETDLDRVMPPLTPNKPESQFSELECQKSFQTPTMRNNASFSRKLTTTQSNRFRLFGLDPRSPAVDFSRTPIQTDPAAMLPLRGRSQDNLNRRSFEREIYRYSYCEMSCQFEVPEVQVLSNLPRIEIEASNLGMEREDKLVKLESPCRSEISNTRVLDSKDEKNTLDFIKTDNANAQEDMCISDDPPSREGSNTRREESLDQVKISLNLDDQPITESEIRNIQPIAAGVMKSSNKYSNETEKIIVWRDSMSFLPQLEQVGILESNDQKKVSGNTITHFTKDEVIITFDDDMIVKDTLSSKISKAPSENPRKPEIVKRNKTIKGEKILAEDKKIFSDNKISGDIAKTRTPLGNRSNNGQVSLLAAKSPQLLRNKGINPKMLQENTPPHKRSTARSKLSGMQWDPDSTVLI